MIPSETRTATNAYRRLASATVGIEFTTLDRHRPKGGQHKYILDLVRGFSTSAPPSTRFVFIGSLPEPPEEISNLFRDRPETWRYRQIDPWNFRGSLYFHHPRFLRLALREGLTLLHCPHAFVPAWVPCPVILTVHDLIFEVLEEYSPILRDRHYRLNRWTNRYRTSRYISISQSTTRDMVRLWNSDTSRITTIHHGHHPWPSTDPCPDALRWIGDDADTTILSTFNLEPRKNLPALLEAVAILAPKNPRLKLVLFGNAACNRERELRFNEHVERLGIGDRILRTGFVNERSLGTLYSNTAMFVFPSLYEGFGYPVLEAMSAGACVVCGRLSSMTEIAEGAGLLVDQCDPGSLATAIETLLNDPGRRRQLGEAGKARAATFTLERMVSETLAVYEAALPG